MLGGSWFAFKTKHVWMSWTVKARTTYGQKLRDLLVETNLPKWSGKKRGLLYYNLSRVHENYCVQFQNHKKKKKFHQIFRNGVEKKRYFLQSFAKKNRWEQNLVHLWHFECPGGWRFMYQQILGTRWPYKSDKFGVALTFLYRSIIQIWVNYNHTDDTITIGIKWQGKSI